MSLRRFPWKQPTTTDGSFKLFVSPPSPGTPTDKEILDISRGRPKSTPDLPSAAEVSRNRDVDERSSRHHQHRHNPSQASDAKVYPNSEPTTRDGGNGNVEAKTKHSENTSSAQQQSSNPQSQRGQRQEVIKGPWRLLRILPRESRYLIGQMLKVNPKERATLEDVLSDDWVRGSQVCQQTDQTTINATNHTHILKPPSAAPAPTNKKGNT